MRADIAGTTFVSGNALTHSIIHRKKKKKKKRKRKRVSEPVDDDSKALVNAIESPAAIGDGKTAGASSSAADSVAAKKKTRQDDTDGMTKSERQFMRVQQKLV